MDFAKHLTPRQLALFVTRRREPVRYGLGKPVAATTDHFEELVKVISAWGGQSITPELCVAKDLFANSVVAAECCDCCPDRFRVGFPHDFADKLFLPAQRAVSLHRLRSQDGIQQIFLKPNAMQLIGRQIDQLFAECLEGQVLAL